MPATAACDFVREDHRLIDVCLDSLQAWSTRARRAQDATFGPIFEATRALLAVHFKREEVVLFPALRPHYPALLTRMEDQHRSIRMLERRLARLFAGSPAARDRAWLEESRSQVLEFVRRLRNHSTDEEQQLLRVAAACIRGDDQDRIASRMIAIR